jgi:predicted nucleotidyltransferase
MKDQSRKILDRSRPRNSLLDWSVNDVRAFLKERLQQRGIGEAYLFGSLATGKPGAWSDIDLILVQDTQLPFIERMRQFHDLLDLGIPVDVLVYTPEEFSRLWHDDSPFWKEVRRTAIRLI